MFGETLAANMPDELIALIVDDEIKESPIANFVFYHYMRDKKAVTPPAQGVNANNYFRSQLQSNNENVAIAGNDMVEKNLEIHYKLYEDETITVFADTENETTLNYLDDILPEISKTSSIFNYINIFNI